MSGISRHTLRLIGAAKYPRTMKLTTNGLNNSLALLQPQYFNHNVFIQGIKTFTTFESAVHAVREKVLSLFESEPKEPLETEKVKEAKTGLLKVSLSSGKVKLTTPHGIRKSFILHPTFNIKLNEESIEPESDKTTDPDKKASFKLDKWHVSRDGNKLILRVRGSDETFILKHAVYIIAQEKPRMRGENGDCNVTSGKTISGISMSAAKLLSKPNQSKALVRSFEPVRGRRVPWIFTDDELNDRPNKKGQMKITFPMTASLRGAKQVIEMKDSYDDCTVYHKVDVQAYKKLPENGNNKVEEVEEEEEEEEEEKGNILRMELKSGDLIIEPIAPSNQRIIIKQEANIEINLKSEVPYIHFYSCIKTHKSLD